MADLVEFTKAYPKEEYPSRNIDGLIGIRDALPSDDQSVERAFKQVHRYDLDVLILPSGVSTTVAAPAGCPVINLLWGFYPKDTPLVWNDHHDLSLRHENTS